MAIVNFEKSYSAQTSASTPTFVQQNLLFTTRMFFSGDLIHQDSGFARNAQRSPSIKYLKYIYFLNVFLSRLCFSLPSTHIYIYIKKKSLICLYIQMSDHTSWSSMARFTTNVDGEIRKNAELCFQPGFKILG